ncbi:hypothetical protein QWA_18150 [Alcaligenes faecalis subsp. faecalis NCIB 8687]|nr:hypothetical protein QWA_18150 [Alcaligenes faecalis subsp. faecalis NCIB 8687]
MDVLVEVHDRDEVLDILWGVQPEFLETAFKTIDATHGSLDRFFQDALQLSPARREAYFFSYPTANQPSEAVLLLEQWLLDQEKENP